MAAQDNTQAALKADNTQAALKAEDTGVERAGVEKTLAESGAEKDRERELEVQDVGDLLEELGLGELRDAFRRQSIDRGALLELTDSELADLGVTKLGDRKMLLREARARRDRPSVRTRTQLYDDPVPSKPPSWDKRG